MMGYVHVHVHVCAYIVSCIKERYSGLYVCNKIVLIVILC
jgi:hypothetical protein